MIIVGERINSTRSRIQDGIRTRNAQFIIKEARQQIDAGAEYIDINCAVTSGDELQDIDWAISVIQNEIPSVSISIDSPNHLAIERALAVYNGKGAVMINSITAEEPRLSSIVPLALKYKARLIALTMDGSGMPDTANDRYEIAKVIFERLKRDGIEESNIYFDALIRPIATEPGQAKEFLDAILLIKGLGNVKTICGLSNVSFGLPQRSLMNAVFLSMAMQNGLDAAILDPTDTRVGANLKAATALLGKDDYCAGYIKAFREGKLV